MNIRITLLIVLFLSKMVAFAQSSIWEVPLTEEGRLSKVWQGNTSHYKIQAGELALDAPKGSPRSYISTATHLTESNSWQGSIRMKALPTAQNYTYILLAQIAEQDTEHRYLALAFGGNHRRISLCEATFVRSGESYVHQPKRDVYLIHSNHLPKQLLTGLSYQVTLDEGDNLLLYLSEDKQQEAELVGQIELSPKLILPPNNHFGIYNAYTDSRRQGVYLSNLRIFQGKVDEREGQNPPSSEGEDSTSEQPASLLLSEIMANPRQGSAEYIELYNNSDTPAKLSAYSLALGATRESLKLYPMSRLNQHLQPRSYYILSTNPDAIKTTYPKADTERMIQAKLPQLRNAGFVLQLYHRAKMIDEVVYDPGTFPKGLRAQRGIALERTLLQAGEVPWRPASKEADYATPTQVNSQNGRSHSSIQDRSPEDKGELISLLIHRLEYETGTRAIIRVYDFLGNNLSIVPESESLAKLKEIQEQPYQGLKSLSAGARYAILLVYITDKDGQTESYDLKYRLK